jgi:hypothetical protein
MKRMNKGVQSRQQRDPPTAESVERRPPLGQGKLCSDDRDRHTGAGSSVERAGQGTRSSEDGTWFNTVVGTPQGAVNQRFCV